jgi:hypothetical protein
VIVCDGDRVGVPEALDVPVPVTVESWLPD